MTKKSKTILIIFIFLTLFIPFVKKNGFDFVSTRAVDFPAFYYASKLVFEEDLTPYHPKHWRQAKALADAKGDFWPYLYPPPSLFLFRPMISLSYEQAKIGMLVLNYVLLFIFLYLFFYKILKLPLTETNTLFGIVYLFSFYPLVSTISHGQINLIILVMICLTWYGLIEKKHPVLVAIPLVIAIFLKIYPVFFLAYFLLKKEYKVFMWGIVFIMAISLASIIIFSDEIWFDWYRSVAQHGYGERVLDIHPGSPTNQSINGFLYRFFWGRGPIEKLVDNIISMNSDQKANIAKIVSYSVVGILTLISFIGLYFSMARNPNNNNEKIEISLLLALMILASPFSWDHSLVLILPAIYIAVQHFVSNGKFSLWLLLAGGAILLLGFDYPYHNPLFRTGYRTLLISGKLYAVGILWLFFVVSLFEKNKQANHQLTRKSS
jgi:hypothetical protein